MPVRRSTVTKLYGFTSPLTKAPPPVLEMFRDPTLQDEGRPGQIWLNKTANTAFIWANSNATGNIWISSPVVGATILASLLVTPGNLTVDTGNLLVTAGTITSGAGIAAGTTLTVGTNATIAGTLAVTGNTTIGGTLIVNGLTTLAGGFNFANAATFHVITTDNVIGAVTLGANGGAAETVLIESLQGTSATSVELLSVNGGVNLEGGLNTNQAINFNASNAAGGLSSGVGTGGYTWFSANGPFTVTTGTGAINISSDAAATTINIGTGAGVKTISIGGSTSGNTVSINNGINAAAQTTNIGSGASGAVQTVNILSGNATVGLQTLNLAAGTSVAGYDIFIGTGASGGNAIQIGTGAAVNNIIIGSATGASSTNIISGTGSILISAANANVNVNSNAVATASTNAATNNSRVGYISSTGFTTAAQTLTAPFTVTCATVRANSLILVTISQSAGAAGQMSLASCKTAVGSFVITMLNNDPAAAVTGTVNINYWVLD